MIIFSFVGYHLVCKPLAYFLHKAKKIVIKYLFDGFNIFEAYYEGFEPGRVARIFLKLISFFITLVIAKIFMEGYLAFIK